MKPGTAGSPPYRILKRSLEDQAKLLAGLRSNEAPRSFIKAIARTPPILSPTETNVLLVVVRNYFNSGQAAFNSDVRNVPNRRQ